ncbi:MAG: type IX secretion system sortase PorU [Candidatus Marinimicrobia bacterium]|nr:type IX secretion system sortase PorU [Candidatus Neomarinimicrobiota bacterium]
MNLKNLRTQHCLSIIILFLIVFSVQSSGFEYRIINETANSIVLECQETSQIEWRFSENYPDSSTLLLLGDAEITDLSSNLLFPFRQIAVALPSPQKPEVLLNILDSEPINLDKSLTTKDFQYLKDHPVIEISDWGLMGTTATALVRVFPIRATGRSDQVILIRKFRITVNYSSENVSATYKVISTTNVQNLDLLYVNPASVSNWQPKTERSLKKTTTLPDGVWLKLTVNEDGIYSLPFDQIAAKGISETAIDVNRIFLFSNSTGGFKMNDVIDTPVPENLVEITRRIISTDDTFNSADTLIFWGRATSGLATDVTGNLYFNRNYYSFDNYYWLLIADQPGSPKPIDALESSQLTANSIATETEYLERHELEINNFIHSGTHWYGEKFSNSGTSISVVFPLPDREAGYTAKVKIRTAGGTSETSNIFNLFYNTSSTSIASWSSTNFNTTNKIQTMALVGGTNIFRITFTSSKASAQAYLDFMELQYNRNLQPETESLRFWAPISNSLIEYRLSDVQSNNFTVFDVTDWANVHTQNVVTDSENAYHFRAETSIQNRRSYFITFPNQYKSPENIENLGRINLASLRTPNTGAKYVIITDKAFQSAADDLADLYTNDLPEADRLTTKVVLQSQIFREFNADIQDPNAIRFFLKYAFENWSVKPEFVLLLGDGTYDYRGIESGQGNYILTYQVESESDVIDVSSSYASDARFVYISGADRLMDMSIGRIPANTAEDAQNAIDKIRSYLTEPIYGDWRNRITLVADDPERPRTGEEYHISDTEDYIVKYIPKNFTLEKLYLLEFPEVQDASTYGVKKPAATEAIFKQLSLGTTIINYMGHGSSTIWSQERTLDMERDISTLQTGMKLPFWIAATCSWGQFDDISSDCMPEALITKEEDGAIAALGATRATYPSSNRAFISALLQRWFSNGKINRIRLGTLLQIVFSGNSENNEKYILFGDPALYLALPTGQAEFDPLPSDSLKALSNVSLNGDVSSADAGFSGQGILKVFDSDRFVTRSYLTTAKESRSMSYILPGELLFKGSLQVENGSFSSRFFVPKDLNYENRFGSINLYSWSESSGREISAFYDSLVFRGSESAVDTIPPKIDIGFQNIDFHDGDVVTPEMSLQIHIRDEHGVNIAGQMGHDILVEYDTDPSLTVEATENFSYDTNSDTSGTLTLALPDIESGEHSVTVQAWDNANNPATATSAFTLSLAERLSVERVFNFPNPFHDETDFTFTLTQPAKVKIMIYTVRGLLVKTIDSTEIFPAGFQTIHWDGNDDFGDIISRGIYIFKLNVTSSDSKQRDTFIGKLVKAK